MKKYLPLIETINSICWFWFDFSWMQDWNLSAQVGSLLAVATGFILFFISRSWSSAALLCWIIMNMLAMNDQNQAAIGFGAMGFVLIAISLWENGNVKDLIRLKIKKINKL